MAREFLRLTPELTWGTFDATSTTAIIVDLDQSNAYTVRPEPVMEVIRTAGGFNRRWGRVSGKKNLMGDLNMLIHGTQGALVASWIDNGGAAAPVSCTVDHCIVRSDTGSTKLYSRDLGVMVKRAKLAASEDSILLRANLNLIGKQRTTITITDLPEPALTDYAADPWYIFEQAGSSLTLGTTRTEFKSFELDVENILDAVFFNSTWITRLKYCGRNVNWTTKLPYDVATDRTSYEALTAVSGGITFTCGSNSLAFSMKSQNFYAGVKDDLALDKLFYQEVSMESHVDRTAGTDFTITAV